MKKILFSLMIFAVIGFTAKVQAQCEIKDVVITINTTNQVGPDCQTNFNLEFYLKNNGGNKIVVIQAWKEDDYPQYFGPNCTDNLNKSPKAADLVKTTAPYTPQAPGPPPFLNIAFDASTNAVIASGSYPGGGVTLGSGYVVTTDTAGLGATGFFKISLSSLTVLVPNQTCGTGVTIKADVWSSQGAITSQWSPHCVICNNRFAFNFPLVSAFLNCLNPRQYNVRINNINTNQAIACTWKTYRDDNKNGVYDIGIDPLVDENTTPQVIAAQDIYNSPLRNYTGNTTPPEINKNLIVVVTTTGLANTQTALAAGSCSPLPVNFSSFTATRSKSNVMVKWETSSEINNTGFAVERNVNGIWEQVAFVPSQAPSGNSDNALSYQYIDFNSTKGVTQYRIRQVDFDQKSKYTEVRSVKGDGQIGKVIIYPNPTANGRVNVVFDDASVVRDVNVIDMSGRTIRSFRGISNNNITIDNLTSGIYSVRIFVPETGEQAVEKIVVNKR